ncbi:MAG: hypothetical protein CME70_19425 [Halobacteriovorax sp.]|nr:hypothetical protein [Halobacteriovorax sp.]MBK26178.1 hypothetical protein [Halobacteriovorax sp.]|tara:strand:+ start:2309 stop:2656 length:348 start_codon:yes stop_codon:yes gene_type:complete
MSENEKKLEAERQARLDIIESSIESSLLEYANAQLNLQSASARSTLSRHISKKIFDDLNPLIEDLQDEVSSLWFMLDEMKASDTSKNKELTSAINDSINLQLANLQMMMNQKGDA